MRTARFGAWYAACAVVILLVLLLIRADTVGAPVASAGVGAINSVVRPADLAGALPRTFDERKLEFAGPQPMRASVTVDPAKHCVSLANDSRLQQQSIVRVPLERGVKYTLTARGRAYMSDQVGADADPFPGVMIFYGEDAEDGYAVRYRLLKPDKSVTFTTPWNIDAKDEVFLLAFFLYAWPETPKHGSYQLDFVKGQSPALRGAQFPG
jgi:hypothetical protein